MWEFIEGVPTLMAPGSKAHTLIKTNAARVLGNALAGRDCMVLVDGAIVEVGNSSLIPDIIVTCAPLDFSTPRVDEPLIVVEILSPSGEKDDLGRKLYLYMAAGGVRHYLTIPQDAPRIVHHEQRDDLPAGQFVSGIVGPGPLRLDPPGCTIDVESIFEGVAFADG